VPKGFGGSKFGPDLLAAIKAALADPEGYAPVLDKPGPPPPPRPAPWSSCSRCC
jgi:ribonuclease D